MKNTTDTLLSQYANSPILLAFINSANAAIDPSVNIDSFYNNIWNISTATGYGLDLWGRIVGINRAVSLTASKYIGFSEGGAIDYDAFGVAPLYLDSLAVSSYSLSDDFFRNLILAKALANISDSSSGSYNAILRAIFPGRGNCYITDTGTMSSILNFEFVLQAYEVSALQQSKVIPTPCGVKLSMVDSTATTYALY
jgi:Protein of unknown function (DUF2612)